MCPPWILKEEAWCTFRKHSLWNLFPIFYSYKVTFITQSKIKYFTIFYETASYQDITINLRKSKRCAVKTYVVIRLTFIVLGQRTWIKYTVLASWIRMFRLFSAPSREINDNATVQLSILLYHKSTWCQVKAVGKQSLNT